MSVLAYSTAQHRPSQHCKVHNSSRMNKRKRSTIQKKGKEKRAREKGRRRGSNQTWKRPELAQRTYHKADQATPSPLPLLLPNCNCLAAFHCHLGNCPSFTVSSILLSHCLICCMPIDHYASLQHTVSQSFRLVTAPLPHPLLRR